MGGGEPTVAGAAAPLVKCLSGQQELVGGGAYHGRSEGVRSFRIILFHPPERQSGGIVAK